MKLCYHTAESGERGSLDVNNLKKEVLKIEDNRAEEDCKNKV